MTKEKPLKIDFVFRMWGLIIGFWNKKMPRKLSIGTSTHLQASKTSTPQESTANEDTLMAFAYFLPTYTEIESSHPDSIDISP